MAGFRWTMGLVMTAALTGCQTMNLGGSPGIVQTTTGPAPSNAKEKDLPAAESARICFITAESLEQGGKFAEAIILYEKARHEDARIGVQATRRLAILQDRSGNFDKALEEYHRALNENPKDAEVYSALGYGYYCRAEWQAAEKQLRKAIAIEPKLTSAWNNLGMTLAVQMRYDESLAAFEKAVPKAQAHCSLGFIQAAQAKFDETQLKVDDAQVKISKARRNYERALELEPGLQVGATRVAKTRPNPG